MTLDGMLALWWDFEMLLVKRMDCLLDLWKVEKMASNLDSAMEEGSLKWWVKVLLMKGKKKQQLQLFLLCSLEEQEQSPPIHTIQ